MALAQTKPGTACSGPSPTRLKAQACALIVCATLAHAHNPQHRQKLKHCIAATLLPTTAKLLLLFQRDPLLWIRN